MRAIKACQLDNHRAGCDALSNIDTLPVDTPIADVGSLRWIKLCKLDCSLNLSHFRAIQAMSKAMTGRIGKDKSGIKPTYGVLRFINFGDSGIKVEMTPSRELDNTSNLILSFGIIASALPIQLSLAIL